MKQYDGMCSITYEHKRGMNDFIKFAQQIKDTHGLIGYSYTTYKNLVWITKDVGKISPLSEKYYRGFNIRSLYILNE